MYKLVEQCWNSQTYDFNWKLWFDNKDAIFYGDSSLERKKTAEAELQSLGKAVPRLFRRQRHIIIQTKQLYGKGWIIRQHSHWVVIDLQSLLYRLNSNSFVPDRHNPVQRRDRVFFIKRSIHQIDVG